MRSSIWRVAALGAVIAAILLPGCTLFTLTAVPVRPPMGVLFASYKAPLTTNVAATPAGTALKKHSKDNTGYFHDIILTGLNFAWDEAEIADIAREGEIEHVCYADYEYVNVFGIYAQFTVNVYGY